MFARFCSISVSKRPCKHPKAPSMASLPQHGLSAPSMASLPQQTAEDPSASLPQQTAEDPSLPRNCSANVDLLTAASGRRKACEKNRSWVSTGQPSQADIDSCWRQVRLARIQHAERERRVLMENERHQGGDSDWMLGLQIQLEVDIYLGSDSVTA
jgi:hypothetical protein